MPKKCVLLLVAAAALSLNVAARSPDEVRAQCRAEGRPCVGLVLSGGGARGFAHVGVLEVLESLGVRVDVVAGTSMGAMVGGAYAAGFSVEDIVEYRRLSDMGDGTIPDRLALMQRKREDMVQQREALDKALRLLNHKIFCYERAVETGVLSWDDPNFDPNTEL